MRHIRIFGIFLLLLAVLLAGCSTEAIMERGADFLNQIFAGEPSASKSSSGSGPAASPAPGSDPAPDSQEPEGTQFPDAVEPSIPSDSSAGQEPSAQEPAAQQPAASEPAGPEPSAPSGTSGTVTPSHTDATFFGPGESFKYLPKGVDGVYACTYSSEDESIASVDPDTGRVTAAGPGTTKIKMHVEYNGQYDFECIVRCNWTDSEKEPSLPDESGEPALPASGGTGGISASHTDATFFGPGESFKYLPKGVEGTYACTYTSEDAAIASVDPGTGKVTAVGPGTTKIKMHVECNGQYDFECIVRCNWTEAEE